jgi:hypothetical protein
LGAVDPADDRDLSHDIGGEPEGGTAECVETVQVLLVELHVGGGEVVAELPVSERNKCGPERGSPSEAIGWEPRRE